MKRLLVAMSAVLLLPACSDVPSSTEIAAANTRLSYAANEVAAGRPIDRAALEALPGFEAAMITRAERAKESLNSQIDNPAEVTWGEIWTPDLVLICGTVEGEGVFYAPNGTAARLPGHYQFEASEREACWKGDHHRVIIPAQATPA